ncbi:DUF460 domain-containing protein [Thermococci archaeon]|nr:MAG: DUF460 domain-containing protein [Thermococci archaeon]
MCVGYDSNLQPQHLGGGNIEVMGVDISKGSPQSKEPPRYSVVVLNSEEEVLFKEEFLNKYRLLRLISEIRPKYLAVDNIYELFDSKGLISFYSRLPPETSLVQVTGRPGESKPLRVLAGEHGIEVGNGSMEEAIACARLVLRGVGYKVLVFEEETRVVVSRGRSLGRGGFSQDRYRRRIHSLIREVSRRIEDRFRERGLEYDVVAKSADGGYSRVEFTVYAGREKLEGVVRRRKGDIQISIIPVEREKLDFVPLSEERTSPQKKPIIVGIDPGTTKAMAFLDLRGNPLGVESSKSFSLGEMIRRIGEVGTPVLVACDVPNPPKLVEKISSSFNSVLFSPSIPLSVEEKNRIVKEVEIDLDNDHERDALASALYALSRYKSKLENIYSRLKDLGMEEFEEEVKARVLKGEKLSDVISSIREREKSKPREEKMEERREEVISEKALKLLERKNKRIKELEETIKRLKSERDEYLDEVIELREKIKRLENKLREITEEEFKELKRDEAISLRNRIISKLREELEEERRRNMELMKKINEMRRMRLLEVRGEAIPLKVLERFTKECIAEVDSLYGIKRGDVVLILDPSGGGSQTALELLNRKIRAVICHGNMSHQAKEVFEGGGLPVIEKDEVSVKRIGDFAIANKTELEEKIREKLSDLSLRRAREKMEWLERELSEYRKERKMEIKK